MTKSYGFILLFGLLMLTACASKSVPEMTTYTLEIPAQAQKTPLQKPRFSGIIKVAIPQSSAAIMSRQILYQDKHYTQSAYLYSRWSDTPNKMLAQLLLADLNSQSLFKTLLPAYSKGKEDFLLESTLAEFYHQINRDGSSSGRIRIKFYLIDAKRGQVLATREFHAYNQAVSLDAGGAVGALNEAARNIASELGLWLASLAL